VRPAKRWEGSPRGVPRILIAEANGLKQPYSVHAGQRLILPRTRHHVVKDGESGFDIAYHYGVPLSSILVANGLKEGTKLKAGQKLLIPTMLHGARPAMPTVWPMKSPPAVSPRPSPRPKDDDDDQGDGGARHPAPHFVWPLKGPVRRGFTARGKANFHDGLDIVAPEGAAARAIAPGTVLFAKEEPDSFGRLVVIDHGNGWHRPMVSSARSPSRKATRSRPPSGSAWSAIRARPRATNCTSRSGRITIRSIRRICCRKRARRRW
jgi:LysM repeat protein